MMHSCSERRIIIWSLCLFFFLSNSVLVIASPANHLCLPDQRDALWDFKNEFFVENEMKSYTAAMEKWRNNTDCCSWDGVSCDNKTGNVIELELLGGFLNGALRSNSSLFRLHHLQILFLTSINFGGILPDSIGNLKHLRELVLPGCNFFGKIPSSLGNLSYLTDLNLSDNDFTGELPDSIGNLNRLTVLRIQSTKLSGNFPHMLLNLSSLTSIEVGNNQFKGILPSNMSSLSKLEHFLIRDNSFSGTIPSSLFMIPSLIELDLGRNHFSGCLEIGNTSSQSKLQKFYIGENNFNGPIPRSLINCSRLEFLNVEDNKINDTFPSWLSLLPDLQMLVLRSNQFHGPILSSPIESSCFPSLRIFEISENRFTGVLPSDYFAGWSAMSSDVGSVFETIDVSGNRFEGDIPESIGLLKELVVLNMSNNAFTGHIPPSLSNLSNLNSLDLSRNRLSGRIPTELMELRYLAHVNFSYNRLEGPIPKSTQIQTPHISSFAKNPGLCGAPLQNRCGEEDKEATKQEQDEVLSWIAAPIGYGYVLGVFCGLTIAHILT